MNLAEIKIHRFPVLAKELFTMTSCLMTVDGSRDQKIHPQRLKDYVFLSRA